MPILARRARMRLPITTVVMFLLSTAAFAQTAATSHTVPTANEKGKSGSAQAAASSGQKVELREPTPEEVAKLLEGMKDLVNDSPEGLTPVRHPDGMLSLDLQGRYQNVTVARMSADGTISTDCVTTLEGAKRFLENKTTATRTVIPAPVPKTTVKPAPKPVLEER